MLSPGKLATPATAATLAVPSSTPVPGGLVPSASVTVPVKAGTALPKASRAATWIAGVIVAPATAELGWTVNASRDGVPGTAVAVNDTGEPASPATLAVAVWGPGLLPSVRAACARPVALVTELGVIVPPPPVTAQFTVTPLTPLPPASVTRTT